MLTHYDSLISIGVVLFSNFCGVWMCSYALKKGTLPEHFLVICFSICALPSVLILAYHFYDFFIIKTSSQADENYTVLLGVTAILSGAVNFHIYLLSKHLNQ